MNRLNVCAKACSLDAINAERKDNQLVLYTAHYGAYTGTDRLGFEVIIEDGVVVATGGNNNAIPKNGMVLSGVGLAKDWLMDCVPTGTQVIYNDATATIELIRL